MAPTLAALDERTQQHGQALDDLEDRSRAADVQIAKNVEQIDNVAKALKDIRDTVEATRGDVALLRLQMPRGWMITVAPGSARAVGTGIAALVAGLLAGGVGGAGRDLALQFAREFVGIEAPRQPVAVPVPVPMPVPMPPASP